MRKDNFIKLVRIQDSFRIEDALHDFVDKLEMMGFLITLIPRHRPNFDGRVLGIENDEVNHYDLEVEKRRVVRTYHIGFIFNKGICVGYLGEYEKVFKEYQEFEDYQMGWIREDFDMK